MRDKKSDQEFLIYCAARYAYRHRAVRTKRGIKWSAWFKIKFGYDLDDYIAAVQKEYKIKCK